MQRGLALILYNRYMKRLQFLHQLHKRLQKKQDFVFVAIGDSAAEGIGATIASRTYSGVVKEYLNVIYSKVTYHNLGRRRSTTQEVIFEQLERAITLKPDLITLSVGANDIRTGSLLFRFEKRLSYLLKKLKEETNAIIIINTLPDFSYAPLIPRPAKLISRLMIKRFNRSIRKIAGRTDVVLVDLYHQSKVYAKGYPEMIATDNFHPSDFGYAIWANSIIHHLQAAFNLKKSSFAV